MLLFQYNRDTFSPLARAAGGGMLLKISNWWEFLTGLHQFHQLHTWTIMIAFFLDFMKFFNYMMSFPKEHLLVFSLGKLLGSCSKWVSYGLDCTYRRVLCRPSGCSLVYGTGDLMTCIAVTVTVIFLLTYLHAFTPCFHRMRCRSIYWTIIERILRRATNRCAATVAIESLFISPGWC